MTALNTLTLIAGEPFTFTGAADFDVSAYQLRFALTYQPGGRVIAVIDQASGIVLEGASFTAMFSGEQTAPCRAGAGIVLAFQLLSGDDVQLETTVPLTIQPNYIRS